jgi:hypothetical protein
MDVLLPSTQWLSHGCEAGAPFLGEEIGLYRGRDVAGRSTSSSQIRLRAAAKPDRRVCTSGPSNTLVWLLGSRRELRGRQDAIGGTGLATAAFVRRLHRLPVPLVETRGARCLRRLRAGVTLAAYRSPRTRRSMSHRSQSVPARRRDRNGGTPCSQRRLGRSRRAGTSRQASLAMVRRMKKVLLLLALLGLVGLAARQLTAS